jgi:hypothetical protein
MDQKGGGLKQRGMAMQMFYAGTCFVASTTIIRRNMPIETTALLLT